MAADLEALLNHLKLEKVHLLGHSLGARTVARFAELFPNRVKSLILEDMEITQRSDPSPENQEKYLKLARKLKTQFTNKHFPSRKALIEALEPYYGSQSESLTHRRARENPDGTMTLLFNPDVSYLYGFQSNAEDLSHSLDKLGKSVLFVRADPTQGSAMSEKGAQHAANKVPNAQVIQIQGSGHTIHRTHPESFLELIDEFMSQQKVSAELVDKHTPKLRAKGTVPLDSYFKIKDPIQRVDKLSRIKIGELSAMQLSQLIERALGLTNSFEIGQYVRLAEDSNDPRWITVLDHWIENWENSKVPWQERMRKTAVYAREELQISLDALVSSGGGH